MSSSSWAGRGRRSLVQAHTQLPYTTARIPGPLAHPSGLLLPSWPSMVLVSKKRHSLTLKGQRVRLRRVTAKKRFNENVGQTAVVRCRARSDRYNDHPYFSCDQPFLHSLYSSLTPFPCTFPHQLAHRHPTPWPPASQTLIFPYLFEWHISTFSDMDVLNNRGKATAHLRFLISEDLEWIELSIANSEAFEDVQESNFWKHNVRNVGYYTFQTSRVWKDLSND